MMRMSLLHAITVVLTVVLFIVRLRCALATHCSGKRLSIRQQGSQHDPRDKPGARSGDSEPALAQLRLFISDPKYKRDPEIDVDSEEIGYEPLL